MEKSEKRSDLMIKVDVFGIITMVLVGIYTLSSLIHLIVWSFTFIGYVYWLLRVVMLVGLAYVSVLGIQQKKYSLTLLNAVFLVGFFVMHDQGLFTSLFFVRFTNVYATFSIIFFIALVAMLFLEVFGIEKFNKITKYYSYVLAVFFGVVALIGIIYFAINAFVNTGGTTLVFGYMEGLFLKLAITFLISLPVITQYMAKKKVHEHRESKPEEEVETEDTVKAMKKH